MKLTTRQDYEKRLARVVAAIEADPTGAHRLPDLAALAAFSPFHFHRIYRAMRGESLGETIRRAKLARAAIMLKASHHPVIDIAQEVGFDSAQSFSRAFRALTGFGPSEFRSSGKTFADCVPGRPAADFKEEQMKVDILEQAPLRLVGLAHEGPMTQLPELWSRLWALVVQHGLAQKIETAVGVCRDAPDEEGNIVYFAGLALRGSFGAPAGLEATEVPGGRYAVYRHVGPYTGISESFSRLFGGWLPQSGHEPDDRPALEIYRNSPYDTPANELITDLLIPVKAKD